MVIEDKLSTYLKILLGLQTLHTSIFNASMNPRVHIVGVLLDGYERRN